MIKLAASYQPWVEDLLALLGFKPGDAVESLSIVITANKLIEVRGARFDLSLLEKDATEHQMVEFTKYLQLHTILKEENNEPQ